jgi:hypothetical protein
LFHTLRVILKRPVHPYALLASGLALLILGTALSGMWHYQYELAHRAEPPAPIVAKAAIKGASTQSSDGSPSIPAQDEATPTSQSVANPSSPTVTKGSNQSAAAPAQSNVASPSASSPAMVTVSLSVNGQPKGGVTLASSSNQCEVLSNALSSGVLSSLDMRYNAQYKTYAVYVINGIGDSNAVWWTYTVNGKSPPYGCSGTTVHSGDAVNWQYVKG